MTSSAVVVALALAAAGDAPFGTDKALHFSASFGVAAVGYAGAWLAAEPTEGRLAAAVGVGLAAGLAKELFDVEAGGSFSGLDLLWDLAGVAVATAIVWLID